MTFNLKANSPDIHLPVAVFPGDEEISSIDYSNAIFSGYITSVATLTGAAEASGLRVDRETFERWKRLGAATGRIDDYVDDPSSRELASKRYFEVLDQTINEGTFDETKLDPHVDYETKVAIRLLHNSVTEYGDILAALAMAARKIGKAGIAKTLLKDVDEYIAVVGEEGKATADFCTASASAEVQEQPGFEKFARWCHAGLHAATLLDHARDLREDARDGLTLVKPTTRNALLIARAALRPLGEIVSWEQLPATTSAFTARMVRFSPLPTHTILQRVRGSMEA